MQDGLETVPLVYALHQGQHITAYIPLARSSTTAMTPLYILFKGTNSAYEVDSEEDLISCPGLAPMAH